MDEDRPLDREAAERVRSLHLAPHPEGGFYRETYRSPLRVATERGERSAVTAIHFLLPRGAVSVFHRVLADEIWVHAAGGALELHAIAPDGRHERFRLGPELGTELTHAVVPAGHWQAARATGDRYALVTCVVAPGFEFGDFQIGRRADLVRAFPTLPAPVLELAAP